APVVVAICWNVRLKLEAGRSTCWMLSARSPKTNRSRLSAVSSLTASSKNPPASAVTPAIPTPNGPRALVTPLTLPSKPAFATASPLVAPVRASMPSVAPVTPPPPATDCTAASPCATRSPVSAWSVTVGAMACTAASPSDVGADPSAPRGRFASPGGSMPPNAAVMGSGGDEPKDWVTASSAEPRSPTAARAGPISRVSSSERAATSVQDAWSGAEGGRGFAFPVRLDTCFEQRLPGKPDRPIGTSGSLRLVAYQQRSQFPEFAGIDLSGSPALEIEQGAVEGLGLPEPHDCQARRQTIYLDEEPAKGTARQCSNTVWENWATIIQSGNSSSVGGSLSQRTRHTSIAHPPRASAPDISRRSRCSRL